jgi:hypothetical protein
MGEIESSWREKRMREKPTGWGNPYWSSTYPTTGAPTFHYFGRNGLSLCGQWGVGNTRELEEGRDDHCENCPSCVKKLSEMKERDAGQALAAPGV